MGTSGLIDKECFECTVSRLTFLTDSLVHIHQKKEVVLENCRWKETCRYIKTDACTTNWAIMLVQCDKLIKKEIVITQLAVVTAESFNSRSMFWYCSDSWHL